ncbi:MAG: hypothetical protein QM568_10175, partial [Microbacterium sp.]
MTASSDDRTPEVADAASTSAKRGVERAEQDGVEAPSPKPRAQKQKPAARRPAAKRPAARTAAQSAAAIA